MRRHILLAALVGILIFGCGGQDLVVDVGDLPNLDTKVAVIPPGTENPDWRDARPMVSLPDDDVIVLAPVMFDVDVPSIIEIPYGDDVDSGPGAADAGAGAAGPGASHQCQGKSCDPHGNAPPKKCSGKSCEHHGNNGK